MSNFRYSIEVKHDQRNKAWRRLSVVALSDEALNGDAYRDQFARDNQMNPDQVAWRIVKIDSASVGNLKAAHHGIVKFKPSAASVNRPGPVRFGYSINLDERGDFYADVRDEAGKSVFEIRAGLSLDPEESSIFDDGFMASKNDLDGLTSYLRDLGVIPANGVILPLDEFETRH